MAISAAAREQPAAAFLRRGREFRPSRAWQAGLILVLLLGAAFLRLYRLDQQPPGLFIDVATNGLDIRDVLIGHHFPVFFERNYGREALFIYFQALLVAGAGGQPIVFAFSAVVMGMLTIALSYRLFRSMFGLWPALFGSSLLAVSFWYVDLSRFGLRTTSLPPLLVATLYCLWRTLRTGRRNYAVYGGVALGLAMYTYIAARLLPLLVIGIWLAEWPAARRYWRQLALLVLVSLAVFAPEGVYFAQHAQEMIQRGSDVSVFNPNPQAEGSHDTPIESVLNTAGMFFVRGDENIRHNVPYRPAFGPILGAFFAAGLAWSLWRSWRDARYRWPLVWIVVMCLPSALSHESPSMFRSISVAPAACLFPGLAMARLARGVPWRIVAYAVGGLIVAATAVVTFNLYFGWWANNPKTYWAYDGNVTHLASFLSATTQPGQAYFALDHRSTAEFLAPVSQSDRWQREESGGVPVPATPGGDLVYVAGPQAALASLAPGLLPGLLALPHSTAPDGGPDYLAWSWPAAAQRQFLDAVRPLSASMAPDFRLAGVVLAPGAAKPSLDVLWQPLQPAGPYDLYVHLLDPSGKQIAQADRLVWPVDEGPPKDDLLLTQHVLDVPPGSYTVEIGAVHRSMAGDRGQLVGGPIGQVARVPLTIPA